MIRRLDRYLLAEILGPLALGFVIYTFIMLLRVLFRSADLIIRSDVAVEIVGQLLLLSLPNIVVLTIPMSFLFAILIAVGRLSSDSELVAIRASGISLFSLYRPILMLSVLLSGVNLYLMLDLLPEGNHALQQLRIEMATRGLSEEIQPRMPHTGWQDKMLYVFESPPGERRWKGVFLSDAIPAGDTEIIVAQWGEARANAEGSQIRLFLTDALNHRVDLNHPGSYDIAAHGELDLVLTSGQRAQLETTSAKRGLRELPLDELRKIVHDGSTTPLIRTMAQVEVHKKFSFPAACIVFGLLGLPLGFSNARGGRSSGFAISIGVIMMYYIVLNWGEDFAKKGVGPTWLAVWLPNIVFLAVGLVLLLRKNADKSLFLSRADQWIQEHLWRHLLRAKERRETRRMRRRESRLARSGGRRAADGRVVLRLPELRLPFPTAVDRYVLSTFVKVLAIAAGSCLALYIVADLTENAEDILKNDVATSIVLDYYKYKSFDIIYQISPVIVLITTLVTFGLLSRTNEVTALKSLGISLYRLALPVVLASVLISGLCGLLQMEVLAASNERVIELRSAIRGRISPARLQRADQRWMHSKKEGSYLFNYGHFDEGRQELQRLQVFQFDSQYRLIRRLYADKATYLGDGEWRMAGGWAREIRGTHDDYDPITEPVRVKLPEAPDFFRGSLRLPEEMHFTELREYIRDLRAFGGEDTAPLEVELHNKLAYPVLALVMALVALPFAFRIERQGALYGIGLSLVLGIALLIFLSFFKAMGKAAILPPAVAMWSPGVIFAIFALYLFLGVRT